MPENTIPKNPHAVELGRKGGKARAASLTAEERSALCRMAVQERWRKYREQQRLTNSTN